MGCANSKRIDARVDVYRPPPTSFSVFDINAIEEPWKKLEDIHHQEGEEEEKEDEQQIDEKGSKFHVPQPLLQKLHAIEDDGDHAPHHSWGEVSKALENLKPSLTTKPNPTPPTPHPNPKSPPQAAEQVSELEPTRKVPRKSFSFHTLEEIESRLSSTNDKKQSELKKTESMNDLKKLDSTKPDSKNFVVPNKNSFTQSGTESRALVVRGTESGTESRALVKENIFIVRDRLERQKTGKPDAFVKRDPLSDYQDLCPSGGFDSVVLYTTSLGGVRRTFEDCNRVRSILELHRVVFDERDVSLHGEFLNELKELLGGGDASVPRLFVKGKYVGGVEEVVNLNELGRLGRILSWARVERGVGRQGCLGCGGARFVPCLDCGGSCKVVVGDKKQKCEKCNENGLVHCPACA